MIAHIFKDQTFTQELFHHKCKEMNIRQNADWFEIAVLRQDNISSVVEVYLKNNYLKSFGYQKMKMTKDVVQS